MTKRITALLGLMLLAGCSGQAIQDGLRKPFSKIFKPNYSVEHFEALCQGEPFAGYGACVRTKMTADNLKWRSQPNGDLNDLYLSWLEAAGHHVEDGSLSEPDARLGAANLRVRLAQLSAERKTMTAVQRQAALSQTLVGLALVDASQPRAPSVITCTSQPVMAGQVRTVCN